MPLTRTIYAYCRLSYDRFYPTTYPYGWMRMKQAGPAGDVKIIGRVWSLPNPSQAHGFSINQWPRMDPNSASCGRTLRHYNPTSSTHGA